MPLAIIESLDHEGRGIAHVEGKAIFIEGALPGETVEYSSYRKKPKFEQAQATHILKSSSQRVTPRCKHFGVCGGCSMQHLEPAAQAAAKQRVLEDAFWHLARLRPEVLYPVIYGPAWGYRTRARLSARYVEKKGGALVGFRERSSSYVADMDSCECFHEDFGAVAAFAPSDRQPGAPSACRKSRCRSAISTPRDSTFWYCASCMTWRPGIRTICVPLPTNTA